VLTPAFLDQIADLASPRMGTERMGPLLYALIRMTRPERALEVGMGYTTPFILKALADNAADVDVERRLLSAKNERLRAEGEGDLPLTESLAAFGRLDKKRKLGWLEAPPSLVDPGYYLEEYRPILYAIDDLSSPHTSAARLRGRMEEIGLAAHLTPVGGTFRGLGGQIAEQAGTLDFIWFDCGGHREYQDFLDEYWPILDGGGGLLLMHYTLTNLSMGSVIKDLKLRQATSGFGELELISLREPDKMMQNSATLIRKTSGFRDRIYYEVRDVSLEND
jgi:predicted O-methyltransferase YrrM